MWRWVVGALLGLAGCTGKPAASPALGTPDQQEDRRNALGTTTPRDAGEMPPDTPIWIRLGSPQRDLPLLASYGVIEGDAVAVLQNPEFLALVFVGPDLAPHVDLARPMDALFSSLDDEDDAEATIAFALKPGALGSAPERRRLANGRWLFEVDRTEGQITPRCELWQAPEPVGFRIVCGVDEARVSADAPFLLGPRVSAAGQRSMRIELSGRGYRELLDEVVEEQRAEPLTGSEAERRGEELGKRIVEEVFAEHVALTLEVDFDANAVELALGMAFRGGETEKNIEAWFGPHASSLGLPHSFFSLPRDAKVAFGSAGVTPGTGDRARWVLDEIMKILRDTYEISDATAVEVEGAFRGVLPKDGRFALAFGFDPAKAHELVESVRTSEKSGKQPNRASLHRLDTAFAGWFVATVDDKPEDYFAAVRRFVKADQITLRRKTKSTSAGVAAAGTVSSDDTETPTRTRYRIVPRLAPGLPKNSLHVVADTRPNPKYQVPAGLDPARPSELHAFLVSDGARVWIAMANDERVAAERARAQLDARPSTGIGSFPEIGALSNRRVAFVGAVTIEGIIGLGLDSTSSMGRSVAIDSFEWLDRLPKRGRALMPNWIEANRNTYGGWTILVKSLLTPDALADVMKWVVEAIDE
jgi:hypothetical protein